MVIWRATLSPTQVIEFTFLFLGLEISKVANISAEETGKFSDLGKKERYSVQVTVSDHFAEYFERSLINGQLYEWNDYFKKQGEKL